MKRIAAKPLVTIHQPKGRRPQLVYEKGGKQVRVSAKSRDPQEIEEERRDLEFRLMSGTSNSRPVQKRGLLSWKDFVAMYRRHHLETLRHHARESAISRLAVCELLAKPVHLLDMTDRNRLDQLIADLRSGKGRKERNGKPDIRPRSAYTVRGTITQLLTALRWAWRRGLIPGVPPIEPIRVAKIRAMRGRPITAEEFDRMLAAVAAVFARRVRGKKPKPEVEERERERIASWKFLLHGLWTSGLRVGELMAVSWDDHCEIVPELGRLPTLAIPAGRQKNHTEESIPCIPEFAALLESVPRNQRSGWVFRPAIHRPVTERILAGWVSKKVAEIGRKAGVVVLKAPAVKYASAHDLRRSVAQRMIDAGVSMYTVQAVMRHSDFKTTQRHYGGQTVARAASELQSLMGADRKSVTHTVCEPVD